MSIDTVNEKLSLITYNQPYNVPALVPVGGGISQDDKQHLIWQYAGIGWASLRGLTWFKRMRESFNIILKEEEQCL